MKPNDISLMAIREQKEKSTFVGRTQFQLSLSKIIESTGTLESPIIALHGIGGVGKSALLRQIQYSARKKVPFALVDIHVARTILDVIVSLREQIGNNQDFSDLDETLRWYRDTQHQIQKVLVPEINLENKSGEHSPSKKTLLTYLGDNDIERFLNVDREITKYFILGLNNLVKRTNRAVLSFDTFEEAPHFLVEWLRSDLLTGGITGKCLIIISGRKNIVEDWQEWTEVIQSMQLEHFSKIEIEEFCAKRNLSVDETYVQTLSRFSKGLPLALVLIAESMRRGEFSYTDQLMTSKQYGINRQIVEQFMRGIKEAQMRDVLEVGATFRYFDEESINSVIGNVDVDTQIARLYDFGFVHIRSDGKWAFHDVVREFINKDINRRSEVRWKTLNKKASEFYEIGLDACQAHSSEWEKLAIERLYHLLWADEKQAMNLAGNYVISDINLYSGFRQNVVQLIEDFPLKTISREYWLTFFGFQIEQTGDSLNWLPTTLRAIEWLENENISLEVRARLSQSVGEYYRLMGNWSEATKFLKKSLVACQTSDSKKLSESVAGLAMHNLAHIYRQQGKYDDALEYIELAETAFNSSGNISGLARVINNKGQFYKQLKCYDFALSCHNQSLRLCQQVADQFSVGRTYIYIAQIYLEKKDIDTANEYFQRAERLISEGGAGYWQKGVLAGRIIIHMAKKEWSKAEILVEQGLALARKHKDHLSTAKALFILANLKLIYGDPVGSLKNTDDAVVICDKYGYIELLAQVSSLRASCQIKIASEIDFSKGKENDIRFIVEEFLRSMENAVLFDHFLLDEVLETIAKSLYNVAHIIGRDVALKIVDSILQSWVTLVVQEEHVEEIEIKVRKRDLRIIDRAINLPNHQPSDDYLQKYDDCLMILGKLIRNKEQDYDTFLVLKQRLVENISVTRKYGDKDTQRIERAEVIDSLNKLSIDITQLPFIDLADQITFNLTESDLSSTLSKYKLVELKDKLERI